MSLRINKDPKRWRIECVDFRIPLFMCRVHNPVEGDSEAPDCAPSQALKQTVGSTSDG